MSIFQPARIGDSIDSVETPALLLDLDIVEKNIDRLQTITMDTKAVPRPHAKSHKCPNLARLQIERGAVGVCCQKVSEAVALIDAGISNILISNEIIDLNKIQRLTSLASRPGVSVRVCVDQQENVINLSNSAKKVGIELGVLVEIDLGMKRCGVSPGLALVDFVKSIEKIPTIKFEGLQAYQGAAQHLGSEKERFSASAKAVSVIKNSVDLLSKAGVNCSTISGSGTGTCDFDSVSGLYTEIQAGSYVVMDAEYGACDIKFQHSLFLISQVMSKPRINSIVLDAGLKSYTIEKGLPKVVESVDGHTSQIRVIGTSDEHSVLDTSNQSKNLIPSIGEKVLLIPSHCDPTVNLHDWFVCIRNNVVVDIWPISARGPGF